MIQELEERKRQLRADLDAIEARFELRTSRLGGRLTSWIPKGVASSVTSSVGSRISLRSFPLGAIGTGLIIAFSSGWLRGGRRAASKGLKGLLRSSVTGILISELRRVATKRAMHYVIDQFEQRVGHRKSTGYSESSEPDPR